MFHVSSKLSDHSGKPLGPTDYKLKKAMSNVTLLVKFIRYWKPNDQTITSFFSKKILIFLQGISFTFLILGVWGLLSPACMIWFNSEFRNVGSCLIKEWTNYWLSFFGKKDESVVKVSLERTGELLIGIPKTPIRTVAERVNYNNNRTLVDRRSAGAVVIQGIDLNNRFAAHLPKF